MKKELKDENLSKVTGGLGGPSEGLIPGGGGTGGGNNSDYICPACQGKSNYKNIIKSTFGCNWTCPIETCGAENHHKNWIKV